MSAIAEAPGPYLIEVRSTEKTAKTGRYQIKVEEPTASYGRTTRREGCCQLTAHCQIKS
jgi:hypothetical protein